jgi:hypothetical protein
MPRKKSLLNTKHTDSLKQKTAVTFGKAIKRSFECDLLSQHIKKATTEYLSAQSLRRFWNFLETPFSPAINTLNILSRYCGYQDWDDFTGNIQSAVFTPINSKEEMRLYLDFFKLHINDEQDMNYHNACRLISSRILNNKALFEGLVKHLAENQVAQVFFFERFPFIDGLGTGYDRGIKLYLQHKKNEEAQVFGICLLLLGAFLSQKDKLLKFYFSKLEQYTLQNNWHPFLTGRYIGSQLLYCHAFEKEPEKYFWLEKAKNYGKHFHHISNIKFWRFPYYQFMMCDYLNLVEEYRLSYELLHPFKKLQKTEITVEDGYHDALCIINGVSLSGLGKKEQAAQQVWQSANFDKLSIIFKKYFTLQYLASNTRATSMISVTKKNQLSEQADTMIRETGFIYFRKIMQSFPQ